ncbi:MAG: DegV family protein [Candidatus Izimaplasma sp.]|nr:DegV family protein [Candidatus Izimaplasma bacterium]
MKKLGILFDSTVYLKDDVIKENNIEVVSLNVTEGDNTYKESDVTVDFIFDQQDDGASWKTSAPSPGEFLDAYQKMIDAGFDKIFCVLLSKDISGTYQSAKLARNMLDDPNMVYIFDTQLCAYGTEMIAVEVIDMVQNNKTENEVVKRINHIISTSHQMFTVENLFSLVKGGRLSKTSAFIGTVLRIKPVIEVIEGQLKLVNKERTYKNLHKYFIRRIKETIDDNQEPTFYLTSQNSSDSTENLLAVLKSEFPNAKYTYTEYLGPVFSIHVGKKGYGLSWFVE